MTKANSVCIFLLFSLYIFLLFSLYIFYYNHLLQTQTIQDNTIIIGNRIIRIYVLVKLPNV